MHSACGKAGAKPASHVKGQESSARVAWQLTAPCNTRASLCALVPPPSAGGADLHFALDGEIMLDDAVRIDGNHACADNVGCGVGGALRTVALV